MNESGNYLSGKISRLRSGAPLRVVDLFAGCGGMSLGFHRAGCEIVGGVELEPKAVSTYAKNFFKDSDPDTMALHSKPHDITLLTPAQFVTEVLAVDTDHFENLTDIIIGGPPCQAFARIGRAKLREIMAHPEAFLRDKRANLYIHFLEYVDSFRPLAVLMENVPDIMNFGGQNVAAEITASLEALGYRCRHTILNSAHYGVPQMRQRFYLIGLLEHLGVAPVFPKPTHHIELPKGYGNAQQVALSATSITLFNLSEVMYVPPPQATPDLPPAITAREALEDLPPITSHLRGEMKKGVRRFDTLARYRDDVEPSDYARMMRDWPGFESREGVWDHVTRYLPRDFQIFKRMRPSDQYPQAYDLALGMFEEALLKYREQTGEALDRDSNEFRELRASIVPPYDPGKFPNRWRKMEPDKPARTLTAHIGKDTYAHIHYDSNQARVISVREATRLQSFPDGFKFTGAMNAAFRQIGNAVPPLQAYALAQQIQNLISVAVS